jgi:predicted  nucleic acid-binding Zn-ribbon protein
MAKNGKKKTAEGPVCDEGLNLPRQTREEYVASLLQQIGAFEERLDELESDMESTGWDDIGDYRGQLDDPRVKLKGLRSRSEELEVVADSAWPDAFEEMEETLVETAESVKDLAAGLSMVLPE